MESLGEVVQQVKEASERLVTIRAEQTAAVPRWGTQAHERRRDRRHRARAKTYVAPGRRSRGGENQTDLDMKGNVRMRSSDGLEVTADSATYGQSEGIVRAPGPVAFKRGRMSGSGVDFSYDENRDLIGLSNDAKVKIAPGQE